MTFDIKPFHALQVQELYDILKLRAEVFIMEQNCNYLDPDGKDIDSIHIMGRNTENQTLDAYCRVLPPGVSYSEVSIGRVCTSQTARRTGAGRKVFGTAVDYCSSQFPKMPIRISAQTYLIHFYQEFGFITEGEEYMEDHLPHISMIKK